MSNYSEIIPSLEHARLELMKALNLLDSIDSSDGMTGEDPEVNKLKDDIAKVDEAICECIDKAEDLTD